ncbi:MAG: 50S ribosomal protein L31e [Candidatus Bathyarchaeota archaeon]|nr:MAG: 50S ribosomal protein L31e [Candidatus Bathyarchaeota archaeon]
METEAKEEEQASEEAQADKKVADADVSEEKAVEETEEISEEETAEETVEAEEEEAKPSKRKKKEEDEDIVEERVYTIPLARALVRPPKKRAPRAMQIIRAFITKHMKLEMRVAVEEEKGELPKLAISNDVNERVWSRGIEKPPRKIRVRAAKDKEGNVTLYLAEGE